MLNRKIMALIPARGGSKGIPKKNIALLGGEPLISYVINAAKGSKYINRIVISTDSSEIAEICRSLDADVPFLRPPELAKYNSNVIDALIYTVNMLGEIENYKPEIILLLQPTSPLVNSWQIDKAMEMLINRPDADAVTSVIEIAHVFHPYNVRTMKKDGSIDFFMPKEHYVDINRQEKPKFYAFGNLYVFRYETLINQKSLFGKYCLPMIIDPTTAVDINDPIDLKIAEFFISYIP
jgi:CMP-N,N'-diacetyllegionaminic acid synthase